SGEAGAGLHLARRTGESYAPLAVADCVGDRSCCSLARPRVSTRPGGTVAPTPGRNAWRQAQGPARGAREHQKALREYRRGRSGPAPREWDSVVAAAFLSDGRSALARSSDHLLTVFDLETGDRVRTFASRNGEWPRGEAVLLPGGRFVLS